MTPDDVVKLAELILAALTAALPSFAVALKALRRAGAADRRSAALEAAIKHYDAHNQAVVLVLTYPGVKRSVVPLARCWGWRIAEYTMKPGELLRDTDQFRADLEAADAVVLQGTTVEQNAALMQDEHTFKNRLKGGVGVISFTPDLTRYDQSHFGDGDQSTTTTATTEAAIRASIDRAEVYSRLQGVRPGGLAQAKADLLK